MVRWTACLMPIESTESAVQIELFCLRYGMLPPLQWNGADRSRLQRLGGNIYRRLSAVTTPRVACKGPTLSGRSQMLSSWHLPRRSTPCRLGKLRLTWQFANGLIGTASCRSSGKFVWATTPLKEH